MIFQSSTTAEKDRSRDDLVIVYLLWSCVKDSQTIRRSVYINRGRSRISMSSTMVVAVCT
jgi:hypothetical protein